MAGVRIVSNKVVVAPGAVFFRGDEPSGLTDDQMKALVDVGSAEWLDEVPEEEAEEPVTFASGTAADLAEAAGLTASDFRGIEPSGQTGYTKADVESVLAEG